MSNMPPRWAVFNQHVNNAGERALAICRQMFPADNEDMIRFEKDYQDGIMVIFERKPDTVTSAYVALVYTFVNGLNQPSPAVLEQAQKKLVELKAALKTACDIIGHPDDPVSQVLRSMTTADYES